MKEVGKQNKNASKPGEEGATYEIYQRCLIIRLSEELDHHNAVKIREKADRLIDKNNIKHIIFDFSGAGFMDSAGIGVIMGRYRKVIFIGGKTAVANVNSAVDRIFRISGLYKIIEKYDSVDIALDVIQKA
jgi:stage II sporulation protein AA (anti-sigma F factor antagonist)